MVEGGADACLFVGIAIKQTPYGGKSNTYVVFLTPYSSSLCYLCTVFVDRETVRSYENNMNASIFFDFIGRMG
jgi:hypothetical protein